MIQWKKLILSTIAAIGIACFAGGTADAASVKIDEKTFPNACVRTFANKQDTNHDGELSDAEIKAVTKLDWRFLQILNRLQLNSFFKGESITANIGIVKIRIYSLCFRMLKN